MKLKTLSEYSVLKIYADLHESHIKDLPVAPNDMARFKELHEARTRPNVTPADLTLITEKFKKELIDKTRKEGIEKLPLLYLKTIVTLRGESLRVEQEALKIFEER